MAETRYHELLGLPEEIADPDYYQLLGLERGLVDPAEVEERFKQRMSKLQQIHSPKHKEFIEFLKGELKKARGILTDPMRRRQYDGELKEEKLTELRKLVSHMLVDGTLSQQGEISLVEEGKRIGLELVDVKRVIDEEVARRGAQRVTSKRSDAGTQAASNSMLREAARELEGARIAARFAEAKAKHAEYARERAEEQAMMALKRAKEAQVLVRQTITRESLSAALEEQEREQLEAQLRGLQGQLEEKQKELDELRRRVETQAASLEEAEKALKTASVHGRRAERVIVAAVVALTASIVGHAVRLWAPALRERLDELATAAMAHGALAVGSAVGALGLVLMAVVAWAAGRSRVPFVVATLLLAVLAFATGAVFLR